MHERLDILVKANRIIDAALLFVEQADPQSLETLHACLSDVVPALIARQPAWLIKHPAYIDLFLDHCTRALAAEYNAPQMIFNITHLRCFKAIALALDRKTGQARVEVLRAAGVEDADRSPTGGVDEPISAKTLLMFFTAYFDYLRSRGHEAEVERVNWIVEKAIFQLGEDESRSGVARALLVNREGTGLVRNVLVAIEEGEGIDYEHLGPQEHGEELLASAKAARQAANSYLVSEGYPEGLLHKKIVWQIARPDGRTEDIKTVYEGASLGLALTIAIISAYVEQPIPSDVAFTGALTIHTAQTGGLVGVAGISEKLFAALGAGVRKVYLPIQNQGDLSLSARKTLEGKLLVRPIRSLDVVSHELLSKPKKPGFRAVAVEVFRNFAAFFLPWHWNADLLAGKYCGHVLVSSGLFATMYAVEGILFLKTYDVRPPTDEALFVALATLVIFATTVLCHALPEPLIERGSTRAWWWSILFHAGAALIAGLLYAAIVPQEPLDSGPLFDWPPYLVIFKDLVIFTMFAVVYISNIYNFVIGVDYLRSKRQFHAVRGCLDGKGDAIGMVPTTVLYMPFPWAVVAATFVAAFLLILELNAYSQLYEKLPQNAWIISMGLVRDGVFIILAFELLCWYWISLTDIKKRLP